MLKTLRRGKHGIDTVQSLKSRVYCLSTAIFPFSLRPDSFNANGTEPTEVQKSRVRASATAISSSRGMLFRRKQAPSHGGLTRPAAVPPQVAPRPAHESAVAVVVAGLGCTGPCTSGPQWWGSP